MNEGTYSAETRKTIAEAPGLRVRLLALGPGQSVPWHYHSKITDTFVCLEGPIEVATRAPDAVHLLGPGETLAVRPGTPHFVAGQGGGAGRFLVIQGVGEYDYIAVDE